MPFEKTTICPFKDTEFELKLRFDVTDQNLVEFDAVLLVNDCLYVSLNVGRLYVWQVTFYDTKLFAGVYSGRDIFLQFQ